MTSIHVSVNPRRGADEWQTEQVRLSQPLSSMSRIAHMENSKASWPSAADILYVASVAKPLLDRRRRAVDLRSRRGACVVAEVIADLIIGVCIADLEGGEKGGTSKVRDSVQASGAFVIGVRVLIGWRGSCGRWRG
jgi:hypothetical protein